MEVRGDGRCIAYSSWSSLSICSWYFGAFLLTMGPATASLIFLFPSSQLLFRILEFLLIHDSPLPATSKGYCQGFSTTRISLMVLSLGLGLIAKKILLLLIPLLQSSQ